MPRPSGVPTLTTTADMLNLLAFFLGINCLLNGWLLTGLFLLYIAVAEELKK